MTQINHTKIPEGAEIFTGPRGSNYILRNGNKVYIDYQDENLYASAKGPMNKPRITPRRKDSKKRGAFLRFIEHQSQSV